MTEPETYAVYLTEEDIEALCACYGTAEQEGMTGPPDDQAVAKLYAVLDEIKKSRKPPR